MNYYYFGYFIFIIFFLVFLILMFYMLEFVSVYTEVGPMLMPINLNYSPCFLLYECVFYNINIYILSK